MKSRLRFHLYRVYMLALAIAGCRTKRPDDVISGSKMENLLYDYHLVKSMGNNLPYDENYKKALYLDAAFKKYGITETVSDLSLVWYTYNTEVLSKICEKVSKHLKAQQNEINHLIALRDNKPEVSKPGDSINVWPWKHLIRLAGRMMNDQYISVLPAGTNYEGRDTLVQEVRYHFLGPMLVDSSRAIAMAMQVIYERDTLSRLETIADPSVHQLHLYADTLGVMKEVKGFIYYPGVQGEKAGALLADRFSLTRYHYSDSLSVAERDSINRLEALKTGSLEKVSDQKNNRISKDSLQEVDDLKDNQRISPGEMSRRRTVTPEKRPEQIEVEQHTRQKRIEQGRERQLNQRRNQQRRQSPSR